MKANRQRRRPSQRHNRIAAVMIHSTRYSSDGQARLALDAGLTPSVLSKLIAGRTEPMYWAVARIATALEKALGRSLDPRELISETGDYPTTFVCSLCGCRGCLPAEAFDPHGQRLPAYRNVQPGFWTGDIHEIQSEKWQEIKEVND